MKSTSCSSVHNEDYFNFGSQLALRGESYGECGFFMSTLENKPWLQVEFVKVEELSSMLIINRKDKFGDRLKSLHIRAGMESNPFRNDLVADFTGPGVTGRVYEFRFIRTVKAKFVSIQVDDVHAILHINGLRFNKFISGK